MHAHLLDIDIVSKLGFGFLSLSKGVLGVFIECMGGSVLALGINYLVINSLSVMLHDSLVSYGVN